MLNTIAAFKKIISQLREQIREALMWHRFREVELERIRDRHRRRHQNHDDSESDSNSESED